MRREPMYLGHPRFTFPIRAKIQVQSIGSGAIFTMYTESLRGWDLGVEFTAAQKPGYNPLSLLEIWIEDTTNSRRIFAFAKYLQPLGANCMLLRIIEIDGQNHDYLQELMLQTTPLQEQASASV